MNLIENRASFGGQQQIWQHQSDSINSTMTLAVYLPPQYNTQACPVLYWLSGLTCTERNFIEKSGFQRYAAEHGIIVVAPDTSPRGEDVADDEGYDLGQGAGFYVNATQSTAEQPWAEHYQMYDYIVSELPTLINSNFNTTGKQSISGHSMGGHGALIIALRNATSYQSVSAFAPIAAPIQSARGQKAFTAYLGDNTSTWQDYDAVELVKNADDAVLKTLLPMVIEQGMDDEFLSSLQPELLEQAAQEKGVQITLNKHIGYDHSYYFVASFIGKHIAYHAKSLHA